jgi:hypothetical protein
VQAKADEESRIKTATDVILKLCIAGGEETIEVKKTNDRLN